MHFCSSHGQLSLLAAPCLRPLRPPIWLSLRVSDPSDTIVEVTILQPNNGTPDSAVFFGIEIANRNRGGRGFLLQRHERVAVRDGCERGVNDDTAFLPGPREDCPGEEGSATSSAAGRRS
ncbi:hypothetical protein OPV22_028627 [Ensete ventricosum]|uniref:Legume lectin domain-containing protein n=1 Tax=Ensete ventricosum TaxID=4639 RepID=A0AAV8Q3A1_ENSVE|nr:hypothetical protein OPV22_028627 [Ensete ventricosum]